MKLEVGIYVKFKTLSNQVKVGQIQLIDNSIYELDNNEVTADKYIVKASHNIIDLIERFDLVNGYLVICKMYEDEKDIPTIIKCVGDYYFKEEDIKSVITHEQMEQMAYKVGD